jgi:hypothetical protein
MPSRHLAISSSLVSVLFLAVVWTYGDVHRSHAFVDPSTSASAVAPDEPARPPVVTHPPAFERNDGQHASAIRFATRGTGYRASFLDDRVAIGISAPLGQRSVVMRFGSPDTPVAESPLAGRNNYFRGRDPAAWRRDVPTYGQVRYPQAWKGIDLVFYGRGNHLEYDVVVAPHADPRAVRIDLQGADALHVDADGTLVVTAAPRELRFSRPVAYQEAGGTRIPVTAAYALTDRTITFDVGAYDSSRELTIDPVLVFSTYLGGAGNDWLSDVSVDAAGATYVTGYAESADFPTTAGAYQPSRRGTVDAFVTKLTRDGALVYSTYFGGSDGALGLGIAVDGKGAAYVVGETRSTDLPVTAGAMQGNFRGGDSDAFIMKLAPAGDRLLYATYLGGSGRDAETADIVVEPGGLAYVTGTTDSADFPTTAGALDRTNLAGSKTGYVAKLNGAGTALVYSTLLTGTREQLAKSITLDSQNRAVVAGNTVGPMTTTTVLGPILGTDAFVLKLNAAGSAVVYSTRIGGSGVDLGNGVALDARDGSPHIVGTTQSVDFPASSPTPSQMVLKGGVDAFAVRLSPDGAHRSFASLIGGSGVDRGMAVDVSTHYVTVFGYTFSSDFPLRGELQATNAGGGDAFVIRLNYGWRTLFSTYLGGEGSEVASSGVVDGAGQATVVGFTQSTDYPTVRAAQPANRGVPTTHNDGFISRVAAVPRGTPGPHDGVVHVADVSELHGNWTRVTDPTAAGGARLHNPDAGLAKVATAAVSPTDYFEFTVDGLSGGPYVVYVRGKAERNAFANDSVFLQFSNAKNAQDDADNERDIFRIGTSEGMAVSVEDCVNCGLSGWGWQDDGYGRKVPGTWLYFTNGMPTTVRVQRREDGVSIDQIVFARDENNEGVYLFSAPGYQKDDDTILPQELVAGGGDIVLYPSIDGPAREGAWIAQSDASAVGGASLRHPDAGAAKRSTPLASPVDYFDLGFSGVRANVGYRIWIRGKADANSWSNDSVHVQFSGSVTGTGVPQWRIGTTSATTYVLEDCTGCGVMGWGWNDNAYGQGALGPLVYFAEDGGQTIRIQTREDGLAIDQIVLSPVTYLDRAPGATKNDTTIVQR